MNRIIKFTLIKEAITKDKTAQAIKVLEEKDVFGTESSVYSSEFYQAEQIGLRPEGKIVMNSFDYDGEQLLKINNETYVIYRTFHVGTDKVELYFAEKVGTRNGKEQQSS